MSNAKLTLVSVSHKGRRCSAFVYAPIINGRAVVSSNIISNMTTALGAHRGSTISIG